jgi:hypothetical protein
MMVKETEFRWFVEDCAKRKQEYKAKHGVYILNNLLPFSKGAPDRVKIQLKNCDYLDYSRVHG